MEAKPNTRRAIQPLHTTTSAPPDSHHIPLYFTTSIMAAATAMPLPPPVATAPSVPVVNRSRPIARVSLSSLTPNNLGTLRKLNSVLFPIRYSEKFYREVLELELEEFCKLSQSIFLRVYCVDDPGN